MMPEDEKIAGERQWFLPPRSSQHGFNALSLYFAVSACVALVQLVTFLSSPSPHYLAQRGISTITLSVLCLVLSAALSILAYRSRRHTYLHGRFNSLIAGFEARRLFVVLALLPFMGALLYGTVVYSSGRPTFIWGSLSAALLALRLLAGAPEEAVGLASELVSLAVGSATIYIVQKFLFPLEAYWIFLVGSLFVHTLLQWLLTRQGLLVNVFVALDRGKLRLRDTLLIVVVPLAASAFVALTDQRLIGFVLPVLWVSCIMQTCMSAILGHGLAHCRERGVFRATVPSPGWLACGVAVAFAYYSAFLSLPTYERINPLFEGDPIVKGIWFTIPVEKTELFPFGYARLEDSVVDDLGRLVVAHAGQALGLVAACDVPGPDIHRAVPSPDPSALIQPKFNYVIDSMCLAWVTTLQGLFWRVGLLGIFVLALVVGVVGFGDPVDYAIIALLLLFAWITWPAPATIRMGNVAVQVAGMPLIALAPPLLRRNRFSYLFIWGTCSGVLFGLAALVRRPCGLALLFTALVLLFLAATRQRKVALAVTALFALLIGWSLIPATLNGLFYYRDLRLQIAAPRISPLVHGSGVPLLGGVGGQFLGPSARPPAEFKNSLDSAFLDAAVWYITYDANPMIGFAQGSFSLMQQTAQNVFVRYVAEHPAEFLLISLRKTYKTAVLALTIPSNWPSVSLLLFSLLALSHMLHTPLPRASPLRGAKAKEMVTSFVFLVALAALPAILTSPDYGEAAQPASAVFFFAAIPSVYYLMRGFKGRAD